MLSLDRLRATHRAWLIYTKNNRNIFFPINFLVLNLRSRFQNIIHSFALWFFFIFNLNLIFKIAKLTFPNLLFNIIIFFNINHTVNIQVSLAFLTWYWITGCELSFILQSWKSNFKNIRVYFLFVLSGRLFLPLCFLILENISDFLLFVNVFIFWEIKFSIKTVWVNSFTRSVFYIIFILVKITVTIFFLFFFINFF